MSLLNILLFLKQDDEKTPLLQPSERSVGVRSGTLTEQPISATSSLSARQYNPTRDTTKEFGEEPHKSSSMIRLYKQR